MKVVEPKICELCRRPFYRQVTIRALAETDCPECCKATDAHNRHEAHLASRTRIPMWTPYRLAERVLSL